ncbi:hypothetical protein CHE218_12930 [Microbacterium sp. che218]
MAAAPAGVVTAPTSIATTATTAAVAAARVRIGRAGGRDENMGLSRDALRREGSTTVGCQAEQFGGNGRWLRSRPFNRDSRGPIASML